MGLAAAVVLALALRLWGIGEQSFWYDEYWTRIHLERSFGTMLDSVAAEESTPPLYYAIAWLWAQLFGTGEAALRALSALLGSAAVPLVYAGALVLATRRIALIAALLVATSPLLVWYSQEARAYSLLVLLAAASFMFFARALRDPRPATLAGWAVASALAVSTHYFAGLLVAPEAALLLARPGGRRRALAAVAGVALLCALLVPGALDDTTRIEWIAEIPLDERLLQVPLMLGVGTGYPGWPLVALAGLLGIGVPAVLLARSRGRERRAARLAAALLAAGLALSLVGVIAGRDYLIARNLLALVVPLALLVAVGLGSERAGPLGTAAAVGLCALGAGLSIEVRTDDRLQRIDWRAAAALVGEPERRLVFTAGYYQHFPLRLYLDEVSQPGPSGPVRVAEVVALTYERSPRGRLCWWGAACALGSPERWELPLPEGFGEVERATRGRFTMVRYVSDRPLPVALPEPNDPIRDTALVLQVPPQDATDRSPGAP